MVDLCQIACEKHAAAEKNRFERNNQAAATMIKVIHKGQIEFVIFFKIFIHD